MPRILLTGGGGFAGGRVIARYAADNTLYAPSRAELDITDESRLRRAAEEFSPDLIIHAAAVADTARCEAQEAESFAVNVIAAETAARAACENGARLIFFSSEQVYNGNDGLSPRSETDICTPANAYGRQKLEAEGRIAAVCAESVILRLTWMYDLPREGMKTNPNLIVRLLEAKKSGVPARLPVNEYRGVTPVSDAVGMLKHAFDMPPGIYNFGCGNDRSTYGTGLLFCRLLGLDEALCEPDNEKFRDRPRNIVVSCRKAREAGAAFPSTEEALKKFAENNGL